MKTHEICVLSHSYIFNINVKYTLHLVRLIIQMNRQDTKEKLQTDGQIVFYCFCPCVIFLIVQTLKEKYTYYTGSRNLYKLLDYSYTGPRNIYRFLTFSLRLYFIVNYTIYIYILLFCLYSYQLSIVYILINFILFIFLLSIFYRYSYQLSFIYILIINPLLYIPLSYLYSYSLSLYIYIKSLLL